MSAGAPLRVVAAALVRDGRLLAARRALDAAQGGLWELPGGKVEAGESDADALVRELEEELGVRVAVHQELAESLHHYPTKSILLVALRCSLDEGEPVAHEHAELRWVGRWELDSLTWAPADIPLLDAVAPLLR